MSVCVYMRECVCVTYSVCVSVYERGCGVSVYVSVYERGCACVCVRMCV